MASRERETVWTGEKFGKFSVGSVKAGISARFVIKRQHRSYFFSGVAVCLTTGEDAGAAFLSSGLTSSFAGLEDGLAVVDGLGVAAGLPVAAGEAAGVGVNGLFSGAWVQAAPKTARTAKTVSRMDLLIVFFLISVAKRSFRGSRNRFYGRPRKFWFHSRIQKSGAPARHTKGAGRSGKKALF